jgi:tRNA(Ile)-lysidine synthase
MTQLNVDPSSRLLAGVSGGLDSMVLLDALHRLGYSVTAGHVNFQLRGNDSDEDAILVRTWCEAHKIDYLEKIIDTKKYAEAHQLNIQSAARDIRYDWWASLVESGNFQWVVTAHHHDDSIETFFLNLLRGTGLNGLKGIPIKRDYFLRPLIANSRTEIESYATMYEVPFRTDQSNDSDDYYRNRVRHHLIPMLLDLNPDFNKVMKHNLFRIGMEWHAWEEAYRRWEDENVISDANGFQIKSEKPEGAFLLKWLEEKSIPWSLAFDFISSGELNGKPLDHEDLRLSRTQSGFYFQKIEPDFSVWIPGPGTYHIDGSELSIEPVASTDFGSNQDPWTEYVDLTNTHWPFELRGIREGDQFQPIGMHGKSKKLQDYFVDLKLDFHEKKQIRILRSQDHILWLIGKRLDERIKIKPGTKEIFKLQYKPV